MSSHPRLGMGPSGKCILGFHRIFQWLPSSVTEKGLDSKKAGHEKAMHFFMPSTMVQIWNVPPELHRRLKARAALEGINVRLHPAGSRQSTRVADACGSA